MLMLLTGKYLRLLSPVLQARYISFSDSFAELVFNFFRQSGYA